MTEDYQMNIQLTGHKRFLSQDLLLASSVGNQSTERLAFYRHHDNKNKNQVTEATPYVILMVCEVNTQKIVTAVGTWTFLLKAQSWKMA